MVRKASMAPRTPTAISSEPKGADTGEQPVPPSHWYTRYLKSFPSMDEDKAREKGGLRRQASLGRPRTAPSSGTATATTTKSEDPPPVPPLPPLPASKHLPAARGPMESRRAPRPSPLVLHHVDAWLDASKPASPLMSGVSYWRDGMPGAHSGQALDVQYTVPVVRESDRQHSPLSSSKQFKSLCRRAKRMQVRMPSLQRSKSQRLEAQKKINRRSSSTPVMGHSYQETEDLPPPVPFSRLPPSPLRPSTAGAVCETSHREWPGLSARSLVDLPFRRDSPASASFGELNGSMERQQHIRTENCLRAVPHSAYMPREQSMGSVSDAPSYFSGLPPPSYRSRSRTASILTTSSFGCVDGMNPEQRQMSQQRALKKQGVKGKLKRLAQRCNLAK